MDALRPSRGCTIGVLLGLVLWTIFFFAIFNIVEAQDGIAPVDCLSSVDDMVNYPIMTPVTDEQIERLQRNTGRPIWLGYNGEHGPGEWQTRYWDMPADVRLVVLIIPAAGLGVDDDHRWIMGYVSPSVPDRIWLMVNEKAPYDSQGHVGYHPCGAAEIVLERVGDAPGVEYQ